MHFYLILVTKKHFLVFTKRKKETCDKKFFSPTSEGVAERFVLMLKWLWLYLKPEIT